MKPPTDKQTKAYKLRIAGKSFRDIGIELGVSPTRAQQIVRRYERWLKLFEGGTKQLMKLSGEEALRYPVIYLPISPRAFNALRNEDIQTIGELVERTEKQLLSIRHFGLTSLIEVRTILARLGLRLAGSTIKPKRPRKKKVICPRCEYAFEV